MTDNQGNIVGPITPKPGWTTTEFWSTIATSVLALIAVVGPLLSSGFDPTGANALVPALATVAAAVASSLYSLARSRVKVAAQTANATLIGAQMTSQVKPVPFQSQMGQGPTGVGSQSFGSQMGQGPTNFGPATERQSGAPFSGAPMANFTTEPPWEATTQVRRPQQQPPGGQQ